MKIFFTPSVSHLEPFIPGERGQFKIRKFNDGELLVKLEDHVENEPVTIITATFPPSRHFCELFFLLDTLKQQEAHIHVIFTYFGYERQDHPKPNTARGALVITNCLKQFQLDRITILHPHSHVIKELLPAKYVIPYDLYGSLIKELMIDTIVAPDTGALPACTELAQRSNCKLAFVEKERLGNNQIQPLAVTIPENAGRALIFDDIISTGATIIQAATLLQEQGISEIFALATHSFINELGLQKLCQSPVQHLWISNSVPSHFSSADVSIINIAPALVPLTEKLDTDN